MKPLHERLADVRQLLDEARTVIYANNVNHSGQFKGFVTRPEAAAEICQYDAAMSAVEEAILWAELAAASPAVRMDGVDIDAAHKRFGVEGEKR